MNISYKEDEKQKPIAIVFNCENFYTIVIRKNTKMYVRYYYLQKWRKFRDADKLKDTRESMHKYIKAEE